MLMRGVSLHYAILYPPGNQHPPSHPLHNHVRSMLQELLKDIIYKQLSMVYIIKGGSYAITFKILRVQRKK